ncbi:MAG: hypothetical protein LBL66_02335 [Clostridiales bacterium]|jgi:ribonuclease-3|nr:hypothetical protein [Clostridiales bacterium]
MFDIDEIQRKLHYTFEDESLLKLAFTHSSYANENKTQSNEKLEFLGDSILNFVIAEFLFRRGGRDEGFFTVLRSKIVSEPPLASCVDRMGIIEYLQCGVGEQRNSNKSDAIRADLFEAVTAAVYLDSGDMQAAEKFILRHLDFVIREVVPETGVKFNLTARLADNDPIGAERPPRYDAPKGKGGKPAAKPAAKKAAAPAPQKAAASRRQADAAPRQDNANARQAGVNPRQAAANARQSDVNPRQADVAPRQDNANARRADVAPRQADMNPRQAAVPAANKVDANARQAPVDPKRAKKEEKAAKKLEKQRQKEEQKKRREQQQQKNRRGQPDAPADQSGAPADAQYAAPVPNKTDYKGMLATYVQKSRSGALEYKVLEQAGPAHEPVFKIGAFVGGAQKGAGAGSRVRDAEQAAARDACLAYGIVAN